MLETVSYVFEYGYLLKDVIGLSFSLARMILIQS